MYRSLALPLPLGCALATLAACASEPARPAPAAKPAAKPTPVREEEPDAVEIKGTRGAPRSNTNQAKIDDLNRRATESQGQGTPPKPADTAAVRSQT